MISRLQNMSKGDWIKIVLPVFFTWAGTVTYWSMSGSSISDIESVLHRRITATKQELVSERDHELSKVNEEIDEIKDDMDALERRVDDLYKFLLEHGVPVKDGENKSKSLF